MFEHKSVSFSLPKCFKAVLRSIRDEYGSRFADLSAVLIYSIFGRLFGDIEEQNIVGKKTLVPPDHWHAHLYSKYLHNMMGNYYNIVYGILHNKGVCSRSNSYFSTEYAMRKGKKPQSKAYFFVGEYAKDTVMYINSRMRKRFFSETTHVVGQTMLYTVKDYCLVKRILMLRMDKQKEDRKDDVVDVCFKMLDHFKINDEKLDKVMKKLDSDGYSKRKQAIERKKVVEFNNMAVDPASVYVKHDRYGRIHTNITSLKREIRQDALECDGKPVGEVDIKSSQPAFLSLVFRKFYKINSDGSNLNLGTTESFIDYNGWWLEHDHDRKIRQFKVELDRYVDLVKSRKIYEFFAYECGKVVNHTVDRKDAKKALVSFLFAPVYFNEKQNVLRAVVRDVWKEKFPMLYTCLRYMKLHQHAALAHELQNIESSFIFGRVIPRIIAEVGCPFATVHDSVIVSRETLNIVQNIMNDELNRMEIPTVTEIEYGVLTSAALCGADNFDEVIFKEMERCGENSNLNESITILELENEEYEYADVSA